MKWIFLVILIFASTQVHASALPGQIYPEQVFYITSEPIVKNGVTWDVEVTYLETCENSFFEVIHKILPEMGTRTVGVDVLAIQPGKCVETGILKSVHCKDERTDTSLPLTP